MSDVVEIDVDITDDDIETSVAIDGSEVLALTELYPGADYEPLLNKPQINDVTLLGNISLEDLGISALSSQDIDDVIN